MSLKVEEKGYLKKSLACPNCDLGLTLYLDNKGAVRKTVYAELLEDNKVKCNGCESILSYQPKKD